MRIKSWDHTSLLQTCVRLPGVQKAANQKQRTSFVLVHACERTMWSLELWQQTCDSQGSSGVSSSCARDPASLPPSTLEACHLLQCQMHCAVDGISVTLHMLVPHFLSANWKYYNHSRVKGALQNSSGKNEIWNNALILTQIFESKKNAFKIILGKASKKCHAGRKERRTSSSCAGKQSIDSVTKFIELLIDRRISIFFKLHRERKVTQIFVF